jgi:cyclophilin family peptidyl-prolyl cis-trans isomerase
MTNYNNHIARGIAGILLLSGLMVSVMNCSATDTSSTNGTEEGVYTMAELKTNYGTIKVELFEDAAPQTVKNFLDLAEGRKSYTSPETGKETTGNFYDGLTFHRVIDGFMIQGGCPLGTGTGGPGYQFNDEMDASSLGLDEMKAFDGNGAPHQWLMLRSQDDFNRQIISPLLQHLGISSQEELDKRMEEVQQAIDTMTLKEAYELMGYTYTEGLESQQPMTGYLAMANSGPNTNGSQFFINLADTPWLTGKHTVFGRVVEGMDIVEKIGSAETDGSNKPKEPVIIESIRSGN